MSKHKCPKNKLKKGKEMKINIDNNEKPKEVKNCKERTELMVTLDLSDTWRKLAENVAEFSWAIVPENTTDNFPEKRIIALKKIEINGKKPRKASWNRKLGVFISDDFFNTSKELVKYGNRFALTKYYLFIATATDVSTQEVA